MAERPARPLSPHLTIWRWGPHMLVSILHRITGGALTVAGLAVLTWWLLALADGTDAYADFSSVAGHWAGIVVLIPSTVISSRARSIRTRASSRSLPHVITFAISES